jgi:hypothetical protein
MHVGASTLHIKFFSKVILLDCISWHGIFHFSKIPGEPRRFLEKSNVQIPSKSSCATLQSLAKFQIPFKIQKESYSLFLPPPPTLAPIKDKVPCHHPPHSPPLSSSSIRAR